MLDYSGVLRTPGLDESKSLSKHCEAPFGPWEVCVLQGAKGPRLHDQVSLLFDLTL